MTKTTKSSETEAIQILQSARYIATRKFAYLSRGLRAMSFNSQPGIGTLAIDKAMRVYFDAETVVKWGPFVSAAVLVHELAHPMRRHFARGAFQGITPETKDLWNIAVDAEINDDVQADLRGDKNAVQLPEGAVYPSSLAKMFPGCPDMPSGLLAEEYYAEIRKHLPPQGQGGGAKIKIKFPCGSGATGIPEEWDKGGSSQGEGDQQGDGGLTDAEVNAIARAVARDIQQHERQHGRGSVPGGWARWAGDSLQRPEVAWQQKIASVMRGAFRKASGMVDYSYRKPGRRQAAMPGVALPSLFRPLPEVVAVIDTSGSMSDAHLRRAISETIGLCKAAGAHLTLFSVDAAASKPMKVSKAKDIKLIGGGGTDMRIGIDAALKMRPRPQIVCVFTDGDTPWPSAKHWGPDTTVIACIIGQPFMSRPPRFIDTVTVKVG